MSDSKPEQPSDPDQTDAPTPPLTSLDLSKMLADWPYESGQISVRQIIGQDDIPRIQLRLDLGILQMETTGRPDGQRPYGCESALEYYEELIDEIAGRGQSDEDDGPEGDPDPLAESALSGGEEKPAPRDERVLDENACRQLREEAVQFYHRYVCLMALEDFAGVIRDTSRNLRVLDLCRRHAQEDDDRVVLEQFRPYILMMRSKALAGQAIRDGEPAEAAAAIDDALDDLRRYFNAIGQPERFESAPEARMLREMRETLKPEPEITQRAELRERLAEAIRQENFELAAILRDEIKMLGASKPTGEAESPGSAQDS